MYRKDNEGWLKHVDFIILDMICLQLAFVLAYALSGYGFNPYQGILYRNMAVFIEFADVIMIGMSSTFKSVLKREHYVEFATTVKHSLVIGALSIFYLFLFQKGQNYSRLALLLMIVVYMILSYLVRECWKKQLRKKMETGTAKSLLIVTNAGIAE